MRPYPRLTQKSHWLPQLTEGQQKTGPTGPTQRGEIWFADAPDGLSPSSVQLASSRAATACALPSAADVGRHQATTREQMHPSGDSLAI